MSRIPHRTARSAVPALPPGLLAGLLLGLFAGLFVELSLAAPAQAGLRRAMPFAPGERLVFDISWTVFHAGEAELEVLPFTDVNGTAAAHFRATARSSEFIDTFYKVRDAIESCTDPGVDRTLAFEQHQREGDYERDIRLDFAWDRNGTQAGPGPGGVDRFGRQGFKQHIALPGDCLDPLSVLYHFRTHYLFLDKLVSGLVTDGKKLTTGQGRVIGRETVTVPAGTFDCWVVVPDTHEVGGVFAKSPGAVVTLWFSADERRIPVKMSTRVVIGSVVLELVRLEGAPAPAAPAAAP
ncbi:MAG: DUF3108 domain-containing protein [Desulfovibrionaceae bacterium]